MNSEPAFAESLALMRDACRGWPQPNVYDRAMDSIEAEIFRLREHIAITIETLTRGDEFPMLDDGANPLQSCIDRLKGAL